MPWNFKRMFTLISQNITFKTDRLLVFHSLNIPGQYSLHLFHRLTMPALHITLFFLLVWCLFAFFMYLRQERLIFHPTVTRHSLNPAVEMEDYELVRLENSEPLTLHGWLVNRSCREQLIIYCGGNGEDIYFNIEEFESLHAASLFVQYRGFSGSEGKPGEREFYSDALAVWDDIVEKLHPEKVFVMGRSLGTAVACHLAANRPGAGTILVTPFDSITAIAAMRYPLLPMRLLLRHHFDSTKEAARLTAPLLVLYGGNDTVVPPKRTHKRLHSLPPESEVVFIPTADHATIDMHPEYWSAIVRFLNSEPIQGTP